jgi:hypothetical protein
MIVALFCSTEFHVGAPRFVRQPHMVRDAAAIRAS